MRLLKGRPAPPRDRAADKAHLHQRLANLPNPPARNPPPAPAAVPAQPLAAPAPISPARAKLQALTGGAAPAAASVPPAAPAEPLVTPAATSPAPEPDAAATPTSVVLAEPVVTATSTSLVLTEPVLVATPTSLAPGSRDERDRRRRRRFGFLLFFGALIFVFFVVRAISAYWEIVPYLIYASVRTECV